MGRKKLTNEDKLFWNVVYNELVRTNSNECAANGKYLKIKGEDRYTDAYPVNKCDIKVYSVDSPLGFDVALEVACHFDLDIDLGYELTKFGKCEYSIIHIPEYLAKCVYNDDYED